MNVAQLKDEYRRLPEEDQLLLASIIAADQMIKTPDYASRIEEAHRRIDQGQKLNHDQVQRLHKELETHGL